MKEKYRNNSVRIYLFKLMFSILSLLCVRKNMFSAPLPYIHIRKLGRSQIKFFLSKWAPIFTCSEFPVYIATCLRFHCLFSKLHHKVVYLQREEPWMISPSLLLLITQKLVHKGISLFLGIAVYLLFLSVALSYTRVVIRRCRAWDTRKTLR